MPLPRQTAQVTDPAPGADATAPGAVAGFAEAAPDFAGAVPGRGSAPWGAVPWRLGPVTGDACCPRQAWTFARLPI